MPISVNWQDDHQDTLLYTIASPWSLAEMYAALTRSYELTRASAKAPRYILFDVSRSDSLPQGFLSAAAPPGKQPEQRRRDAAV
ncbi:hypothetical protein HC928_24760, partial [bacterium]|nr:hypothetical protein [bacterium]